MQVTPVPNGIPAYAGVAANTITAIGANFYSYHGIPADVYIYQTGDGMFFYAPPNANFTNVYNDGSSGGYWGMKGAEYNFGTNDFQRNLGYGDQTAKYGAPNWFFPAYTDGSNYGVGVYMAGAGAGWTTTQNVGWLVAKVSIDHSPAAIAKKTGWWWEGWNDWQP
jgi:hypothetical protein